MRKSTLLCLLLILAIIIPVLPVQVFATTNETNETTAITSQIDGISLMQKGVNGGGVMLEQYALSTRELSSATYFVVHF